MAFVDNKQRLLDTDEELRNIEAGLVLSLSGLFTTIQDDFERLYSATGIIVDANVYNEELSEILVVGYAEVETLVGGDIIEFIEDEPEDNLSVAVGLAAVLAGNTIGNFLDNMQSVTDDR